VSKRGTTYSSHDFQMPLDRNGVSGTSFHLFISVVS